MHNFSSHWGRERESHRILSHRFLCLPISLITKPSLSLVAKPMCNFFRLLWATHIALEVLNDGCGNGSRSDLSAAYE